MRKYIFALLVVGILFGVSLPSSVLALDAGSVGGRPANPKSDNPRTQSIFVFTLKPGQSAKDGVLVSNNTDQTQPIDVYATDSITSSGGAFACKQKVEPRKNEGGWIELEKQTVEVPARSNKVVNFTVEAPNNASVGEHNACIVIQSAKKQESAKEGMVLSFRSAIRVAITVPGEIKKQLDFQSFSHQQNGGKLVASQTLHNGGNVSLDTTIDTKLKTIFGNTLEKQGGQYPIMPGMSTEFNFEFNYPGWGGFYTIKSTATYDDDKNTTLGQKGQSTKTLSRSETVFLIPDVAHLSFYLIGIFALLTALLFKNRRKKRKKQIKKTAVKHKVKEGETLTSIANDYMCDWKQIVKMNKLKSGAKLKVGTVLLVVPGKGYKKTDGPTP